jgi:hypothetical protein
MRLLILAAALAAPSSSPASPQPAAPPAARTLPPPGLVTGRDCRRPETVIARTPAAPQGKSLGELPPADMMLAVYNEVDGCMEPRVIRYGVGGR